MPQLTQSALSKPDSRGLVHDLKDLIGVVKRNWRIVAVAMLVCLTVAVIYLARQKLVYQSTSRLLILQQGRSPLNVASNDLGRPGDAGDDDLPTHAIILRSPVIVGRAIESIGLKDMTGRQAIVHLTVSRPDPTAKILQVSYQSGDRAEATRVLTAITDTYRKFLEEKYQKNNQSAVTLMKKARDELSHELRELEQKYLELHQKSPAMISDEAGRSFLARRIDQWDRAANEAMIKAVQLKSQLELGRKLANDGSGAWTVAQAMGQLGGAMSPGPGIQDVGEPESLHGRIQGDLADTEVQRTAATYLLDQLRAGAPGTGHAQPVDDAELTRAFFADSAAAPLYDDLRSAREKLARVRSMVRHANDPAVTQLLTRITTLKGQLDQLWRHRRPVLLAQATRGAREAHDDRVREAEANLLALKARETSLRKKLDQLDSGRLRQLEEQERLLAGRLGPDDQRVRDVRGQIDQIRADAPGHREREGTSDMLGAIEKSLESVETMRAELRGRFDEDLAASQKVEITRLAVSNVQGDLERQRALFNTVVDQLKQTQLAGDFGGVTAQVIDPPDTAPVRPQAALIVALALMAGLVLGTGTAVLSDLMDQRIRTVDEIRKALDLNTLGLIPLLPAGQVATPGGIGLLAHVMPRSPLAEGFRIVRTNLDLHRRNRRVQVILVTSPQPGDGKSTTASNLAISVAQAGRRVLLIDADLRRPTLGLIHNLSRDRGLIQLLHDQLPSHRAVQASQVGNLDVITAGPEVSNPAERLTSPRLGEAIGTIRQSYDTVIIDSPPLLTVADAAILGGLVDGIILVVRPSSLRRQDAERTAELLGTVGTPILGVVINGVEPAQTGYGYGYDYGNETNGTPSTPKSVVAANSGRRAEATLAPREPLVNGHAPTSGPDGLLG